MFLNMFEYFSAGLVVGAALVATSISITALVLKEINQSRKVESRI